MIMAAARTGWRRNGQRAIATPSTSASGGLHAAIAALNAPAEPVTFEDYQALREQLRLEDEDKVARQRELSLRGGA